MSYLESHPEIRIASAEDGHAWVDAQLAEAKKALAEASLCCDASIQRRLYRRVLMLQFFAFGSVSAMHRTGLFTDVAYNRRTEELRQLIPVPRV